MSPLPALVAGGPWVGFAVPQFPPAFFILLLTTVSPLPPAIAQHCSAHHRPCASHHVVSYALGSDWVPCFAVFAFVFLCLLGICELMAWADNRDPWGAGMQGAGMRDWRDGGIQGFRVTGVPGFRVERQRAMEMQGC